MAVNGLITAVFKAGDKLDPNKYRGRGVTPALAQLFAMPLHARLVAFSQFICV